MKKIATPANFKTFVSFLMLCCIQAMVWAQDSTSTSTSTSKTTTTTTTSTWYMQPWIWVVGGVLLLLIIIALMRGSSSTTEKTTVIRNTPDSEA